MLFVFPLYETMLSQLLSIPVGSTSLCRQTVDEHRHLVGRWLSSPPLHRKKKVKENSSSQQWTNHVGSEPSGSGLLTMARKAERIQNPTLFQRRSLATLTCWANVVCAFRVYFAWVAGAFDVAFPKLRHSPSPKQSTRRPAPDASEHLPSLQKNRAQVRHLLRAAE